jgi:hypothetical protein
VRSYSAPTLRAFAHMLERGEFDIALAPAHLQRLAILDWRWQPLARPAVQPRAVLVQRRGEPLRLPDDLVGTHVAMLEPVSLVTLVGLEWLAAMGLAPGRTLNVDYITDPASMMIAIGQPRTTAAVLADTMLADMPEAARAELQIHSVVATLPPPGYIGNPALLPVPRERVLAALLDFAGTGDGNGTVSRATLRPLALSDTAGIDQHTVRLRQALPERGRRNA